MIPLRLAVILMVGLIGGPEGPRYDGFAQDPPGAGTIVVDASRPGHAIPASMYGIFFEEISHAGEGGLYAELVQNRGFEDARLPK